MRYRHSATNIASRYSLPRTVKGTWCKLELYHVLDEGITEVREGCKRPLAEVMRDILQGIADDTISRARIGARRIRPSRYRTLYFPNPRGMHIMAASMVLSTLDRSC